MAKQKRASLRALIAPPPPTVTEPPAPPAIYQLSTTVQPDELPAAAAELGPELLELARRYLGARRRSGEALLEAARWLSEARQIAAEGGWYAFLQVTATSEDVAERLRNIHHLAARSPAFEAAVVQGRLNQSVAALLARPSTPPAVLERVLAESAPSVGLVQRTLRAARQDAAPDRYVESVESVETPLIAGSSGPGAHSAADVRQLSPAALEAVAAAAAQLSGLAARRVRLSPADRAALAPLAEALRALLGEAGS